MPRYALSIFSGCSALLLLAASLAPAQITSQSVQIRHGGDIVMATSGAAQATDVGLVVIPRDTVAVNCVAGCVAGVGGGVTSVNIASVAGVSQSGPLSVYATTTTAASAVSATITNTPTVLQGTIPWNVSGTVQLATTALATGSNVVGYVGQSGNWTVATITNPVTVNTHAVTQSGTWNIASITSAPLAVNCTGCSAASAVTATITNIPTVLQGTIPWNVSGAVQVATTGLATGSNVIGYVGQNGNWTITAATIPGTVTVNTHAVTQSGTWNIASLTSAPLAVQQSGNWTVLQGTAPWSISGNVAVATAGLATGTNIIGGVNQGGIWNINQATTTELSLAATALPTAVGNGANVQTMADKFGRTVVVPQGDRALATFGSVTIATTVETTMIPPAGASTFWDLTSLFCSNTNSASSTRVDIRDTPAGTVRHSAQLAANGGGFVLPLFVPFPQQSSNATWTVQLSQNITDVRCNFVAVKNK